MFSAPASRRNYRLYALSGNILRVFHKLGIAENCESAV